MTDHPYFINTLVEVGAPLQPRNSIVIRNIDNRDMVSWTIDSHPLPMVWVVSKCDAEGQRTPSHGPGIMGGDRKYIKPPSGRYERDVSSETLEKAIQLARKCANGLPIYIELSSHELGFGLFRVDVEPDLPEQRESLASLRIKVAAYDERRNAGWRQQHSREELKRLVLIVVGLSSIVAAAVFLLESL